MDSFNNANDDSKLKHDDNKKSLHHIEYFKSSHFPYHYKFKEKKWIMSKEPQLDKSANIKEYLANDGFKFQKVYHRNMFKIINCYKSDIFFSLFIQNISPDGSIEELKDNLEASEVTEELFDFLQSMVYWIVCRCSQFYYTTSNYIIADNYKDSVISFLEIYGMYLKIDSELSIRVPLPFNINEFLNYLKDTIGPHYQGLIENNEIYFPIRVWVTNPITGMLSQLLSDNNLIESDIYSILFQLFMAIMQISRIGDINIQNASVEQFGYIMDETFPICEYHFFDNSIKERSMVETSIKYCIVWTNIDRANESLFFEDYSIREQKLLQSLLKSLKQIDRFYDQIDVKLKKEIEEFIEFFNFKDICISKYPYINEFISVIYFLMNREENDDPVKLIEWNIYPIIKSNIYFTKKEEIEENQINEQEQEEENQIIEQTQLREEEEERRNIQIMEKEQLEKNKEIYEKEEEEKEEKIEKVNQNFDYTPRSVMFVVQ